MSKAVAIAATASTARRVQWVMIGMLMTVLAALSLSAWSQPAASQPGMGGAPETASPQRGDRGPGMGGMHGMGERHGMGGMHHGMGGDMMFRGSPEPNINAAKARVTITSGPKKNLRPVPVPPERSASVYFVQ